MMAVFCLIQLNFLYTLLIELEFYETLFVIHAFSKHFFITIVK
jgi:hypothetical protein